MVNERRYLPTFDEKRRNPRSDEGTKSIRDGHSLTGNCYTHCNFTCCCIQISLSLSLLFFKKKGIYIAGEREDARKEGEKRDLTTDSWQHCCISHTLSLIFYCCFHSLLIIFFFLSFLMCLCFHH